MSNTTSYTIPFKLTFPLGIPEVEELAREAHIKVLRAVRDSRWGRAIGMFSQGERVELLTRLMVRERIMDALKGRLDTSVLRGLSTAVLFETAYPTPPPSWRSCL